MKAKADAAMAAKEKETEKVDGIAKICADTKARNEAMNNPPQPGQIVPVVPVEVVPAAKMKTAGFGQPTPGTQETMVIIHCPVCGWQQEVEENMWKFQSSPAGHGYTCGSRKCPSHTRMVLGPAPDTHKEARPAGPAKDIGLKTVEGQIIAIDKPAHKITLKDRAGEHHTFVWGPANDADFQKLEQWWFCKVTGEHQEDFDIWKAMGTVFFKRPDDWPARGGASGGRQHQPRNERLIAFLALHRDAVALFQSTTTPDSVSYEEAEDIVYERAKKTLNKAMKDFGGA